MDTEHTMDIGTWKWQREKNHSKSVQAIMLYHSFSPTYRSDPDPDLFSSLQDIIHVEIS